MNPAAALCVAGVYAVMSAAAFTALGVDKRRAARGDWRVREGSLHLIELLGGWPGSWAGQRVFRHKWKKTRYVLVFWGIVLAHVLGWVWWSGILR